MPAREPCLSPTPSPLRIFPPSGTPKHLLNDQSRDVHLLVPCIHGAIEPSSYHTPFGLVLGRKQMIPRAGETPCGQRVPKRRGSVFEVVHLPVDPGRKTRRSLCGTPSILQRGTSRSGSNGWVPVTPGSPRPPQPPDPEKASQARRAPTTDSGRRRRKTRKRARERPKTQGDGSRRERESGAGPGQGQRRADGRSGSSPPPPRSPLGVALPLLLELRELPP